MKPTAAAHQKREDDAGYLAIDAERAEQECRETLLALDKWEFREPAFPHHPWSYMDAEDVTDAACQVGFNDISKALARLDTDPLEAVRILKECRGKAVEDVLGRVDFESIVKANNEQRDAA